METTRILIADDHPLFRKGVRAMLDLLEPLQVVGEAGTGNEVVALAETLQPDLILMDIAMPGLNGIEATRQILGTSPHIKIIIMTMMEDENSVFAAMQAGVSGYLLKGADQDAVMRAIDAALRGEALFSPAIAHKIIAYFAKPKPAIGIFPELTEREHEVLKLIAQGVNNPQIAETLGITLKTVRNHVSNIFTKLQVADRAQAIIRARDAGLK
jgi:DNA-binding NarL/FixJ family response regulator